MEGVEGGLRRQGVWSGVFEGTALRRDGRQRSKLHVGLGVHVPATLTPPFAFFGCFSDCLFVQRLLLLLQKVLLLF